MILEDLHYGPCTYQHHFNEDCAREVLEKIGADQVRVMSLRPLYGLEAGFVLDGGFGQACFAVGRVWYPTYVSAMSGVHQ